MKILSFFKVIFSSSIFFYRYKHKFPTLKKGKKNNTFNIIFQFELQRWNMLFSKLYSRRMNSLPRAVRQAACLSIMSHTMKVGLMYHDGQVRQASNPNLYSTVYLRAMRSDLLLVYYSFLFHIFILSYLDMILKPFN